MPKFKYLVSSILLISIFSLLFYLIVEDLYFDNGELCYPLDDAFIHLAISENVIDHNVFGLTEYQFTSSSSSPVYTMLLAATMMISPENITAPLVLNFAISIALILLTLYYLIKNKISYLVSFAIAIFLILATPLPAVASLGMEHTLHILSSVLVFFALGNFLESDSRKDFIILAALLSISILVRYENLAGLAVISAIIFFKSSKIRAVKFALIGILPFVLFGIFAVLSGGFFLPNSVLVKGSKAIILYILNPINFLIGAKYPWMASVFYFNLLALLAKHFLTKKGLDTRSILAIYVLIITLTHVTAAEMGQLYRYEAYLMYLNILSFTMILSLDVLKADFKRLKSLLLEINWKNIRQAALPIGLALVILTMTYNRFFIKPLKSHIAKSHYLVIRAATNIHSQQFQTSKMIGQYFDHSTIVANDIGAICYFNDIKLIDLVGLGSNEKISIKLSRLPYDKQAIEEICSGKAELAVIYDSWFIDRIPDSWQKIAAWSLPDGYGLGDSIVSFYSISPQYNNEIRQKLEQFQKQLPERVIVK